jgi:hypothetical protein
MITYQTTQWSAVMRDERYGWDYGTLVFQSKEYDNPTDAMMEFNREAMWISKWIGTIKMIIDGEVVEEQIFDSTVLKEA